MMLKFQGRCMSYEIFEEKLYKTLHRTWFRARRVCQDGGGDLGTVKTHDELIKLHDLFKGRLRKSCAYVGLRRMFSSSDNIYR